MTVWNVSTDAWGPSPNDATDRVFSSLPSLRLSPAAVPTRDAEVCAVLPSRRATRSLRRAKN